MALTVGVTTILEARRIILVVTGREKAKVLDSVIASPPTPQLPASFLHQHPDAALIADREAMKIYVLRTDDHRLSFQLEPKDPKAR